MSEHTPTPWVYRPHEFDDWGVIRGPNDGSGHHQLAAIARGKSDKSYDEHRRDDTDPYAANATFIIKAVNNHDALVTALREIIRVGGHDLCRGIASEALRNAGETSDA